MEGGAMGATCGRKERKGESYYRGESLLTLLGTFRRRRRKGRSIMKKERKKEEER